MICGILQSSTLGPLLFILYSADVTEIAERQVICIRASADDLQLYASCAASDLQTSTDRWLACVSEINQWMSSVGLSSMLTKTEPGSAQASTAVSEVKLDATRGW